ncbi:MAG: phosphate ABC transporter permease PstA [Candidatus Nanopelagicales bacterium]
MNVAVKSNRPWRSIDKTVLIQQLFVHLGTPVVAMFITINTGMSGYSGFLIVWFFLHLVTASLLGKFGKRKKAVTDSMFEVLSSAAVIAFLLFVTSVLEPVFQLGLENFQIHHLFEDAKDTGVDTSLDIGGLGHALLGTLLTVGLATLFSLPIGILAALYVTEVRGVLTPFVRFFVQAMSGVPSIIAGLFAYAVFIASGILTYSGFVAAIALSILMLPTVARTAEEVLKLVPDDLRSAALALGGTQWRSVRMVVLPAARSGLVTAAILGIARVIGETAPLLLTAFGNREYNLNPLEGPIATLPTYIFQQFLLGTENDVRRAWVAAFVLLVLVGIVFSVARVVSSRFKQA